MLVGRCFAVGESIMALDFAFHGYRVSCLRGRYRCSISAFFGCVTNGIMVVALEVLQSKVIDLENQPWLDFR